MAEKPILFSGSMVRTILDGRKTQTRRVVKPYPDDCERIEVAFDDKQRLAAICACEERGDGWIYCPYGRGPRVTFKPIPRTNGRYFAGDDGVIYNSDLKPMSPWLGGYKQNYQMVAVGELRKEYIHQLVCEAFYGVAPEGLSQVRHMDGNSKNNTPTNLDWGTPEQNRADSSAHGSLTGSSSPHARLSGANVEHIRQQRGITTIPHLAALFDVDVETVRDVLNGKTWANHIQPPRNLPAYIPEQPGDRLWVRETFLLKNADKSAVYRAAIEQSHGIPEAAGFGAMYGGWKPSIFMPRWASRLTLEITEVRVERVQDISLIDCQAEGITLEGDAQHDGAAMREAFRKLWDSINSKRGIGWDKNPWVWAISFRKVEAHAH